MVQLLSADAVTDGVRAGASRPRSPGPATIGRGAPSRPRPGVSLLADRIAAALMLHEPGWRLPRPSALARHYHVTSAEVEKVLDELVSRRLVRRLPDGQLSRSSPAEYLIPLAGMASLGARVDPMGGRSPATVLMRPGRGCLSTSTVRWGPRVASRSALCSWCGCQTARLPPCPRPTWLRTWRVHISRRTGLVPRSPTACCP